MDNPAVSVGAIPVQVQDFIKQAGLSVRGPDATHAVRINHPGLCLCPIEAVPGMDLEVLAALLPDEGEESEE